MATKQEQYAALNTFLIVWSSGDMLSEVATTLTCTECDALARLLRAHGENEAADTLLDAHVEGDEDGDDEEHLKRKEKNAH